MLCRARGWIFDEYDVMLVFFTIVLLSCLVRTFTNEGPGYFQMFHSPVYFQANVCIEL
jgi:hypothetical protein